MNYELEQVSPTLNTSTRIYHLFLAKNHYMNWHYHPYLEIVYLLQGSFNALVDGKKQHYQALDILVIPPSMIHCLEMCEDCEMITLLISYADLKSYDPDLDKKEFFISEDNNQFKELIVAVDKVRKSKDQFKQLLVEKYLCEINYYILTAMTRKQQRRQFYQNEKVLPVIEYIEAHYQEHISYQKLSHEFGYSYAYFCRFFKQMTGTTLLQFQKTIQLKHAYLDVCYSDKQINQIAYQHGFYNTKLFIEAFKKEYSLTPNQYRRINVKKQL